MVSAYPYSSGMLSMLMMPPTGSPLEPLPLGDLLPFDKPPTLPRRGVNRRRCTAALAMLLAGCGSAGLASGEDEDEVRCRYPSKRCHNTRVRKASGGLHRYCAHHRDKANANQQRWVSRHRGGSKVAGTSRSTVSSPASSTSSSPSSDPSQWTAMRFDELCVSAGTLGDDEWDALLSLLDAPTSARTPMKTPSPRRHRGHVNARRVDGTRWNDTCCA